MFFAEPAVQMTTGNRGKTTRQARTKTVRGPEGAWIAQMKEELAAAGKLPVVVRKSRAQKIAEREAERAANAAYRATLIYEVLVEMLYRGVSQIASGGRYATLEAATEATKGHPIGKDRSIPEMARVRVWIAGPETK